MCGQQWAVRWMDGITCISCGTAAGEKPEERLLVYDTERGLWQEENGCSYEMASTGGQLYLWDGADIWAADPSRESDWQTTEGVGGDHPL